jgi:hypothetical protein
MMVEKDGHRKREEWGEGGRRREKKRGVRVAD